MKAISVKSGARNGVALVIVLGLLSVITMLAVAFAVAMRVERMAARNYANAVRAEHLTRTALVRAVTKINEDVKGACYPSWTTLSSEGDKTCSDILSGEAQRSIPSSLLEGGADTSCGWTEIKSNPGSGGEVVHGRVAWLAFNASGLLDPNLVGGMEQQFRTNIHEIDISELPEVKNKDDFFADRKDVHRRYETVEELPENKGLDDQIACLFPYSLDIDRDQIFKDVSKLGTDEAKENLEPKFWINQISEFTDVWNKKPDLLKYQTAKASNPAFLKWHNELFEHIKKALPSSKGERPDDVMWNFLNWLDPDKIPQGKDSNPWAHTEGGEAVPLINEIVLTQLKGDPDWEYEFTVELWYPFSGVDVEESDNFFVEMAIWDNYPNGYTRNIRNVMKLNPDWKIDDDQKRLAVPVGQMKFGTPSEFRMFKSEPITLGESIESNEVFFLARVLLPGEGSDTQMIGTDNDIPVDQAGGSGWDIAGSHRGTSEKGRRNYDPVKYETVGCWEVDDPRSNGKVFNWQLHSLSPSDNTLNRMNARCNPWPEPQNNVWRQGLPIYVTNGLMRTIGEVGYIYRSNIAAEDGTWDTIDLMHPDKGAYLLDHLTTRNPTNRPPATKGLVSINSQQKDALRALFTNMKFGYTDGKFTTRPQLRTQDANRIVDALVDRSNPESGAPFISFRDIFTDPNTGEAYTSASADPVRNAFYGAAINASLATDTSRIPNDKDLEDPFRQIVDLISFRQNIYTIICAAQVYAPESDAGKPVVVGEKRAMATVYRDSYTGDTFTRSFKWLTDE